MCLMWRGIAMSDPIPGELKWFGSCGSNNNVGEWKLFTDKVVGAWGNNDPRWVPIPPQLKKCRYCGRMDYDSRCPACGAWL